MWCILFYGFLLHFYMVNLQVGTSKSYSKHNVKYFFSSQLKCLQGQGSDAETLSALSQLKDIVMASDISPFEVNHSGLIRSLLQFLTRASDNSRDDRLRAFLNVFANCPVSNTTQESRLQ